MATAQSPCSWRPVVHLLLLEAGVLAVLRALHCAYPPSTCFIFSMPPKSTSPLFFSQLCIPLKTYTTMSSCHWQKRHSYKMELSRMNGHIVMQWKEQPWDVADSATLLLNSLRKKTPHNKNNILSEKQNKTTSAWMLSASVSSPIIKDKLLPFPTHGGCYENEVR